MSLEWSTPVTSCCELADVGDGNDERLCFFDSVPKGVERYSYRFGKGIELSSKYPPDAKLYMEKKYPGVKLPSYIGNTSGMLLVSRELRETIERHSAGAAIEYLPVTIIDHKRRQYSTDYTIVNPLGTFDCADDKASEIEYMGDKVVFVHRLVLSTRKLKKAPQLFRPNVWPSKYLFGPDLVDDIRSRKFTNVLFDELETTL